jgi:hypothetical protein
MKLNEDSRRLHAFMSTATRCSVIHSNMCVGNCDRCKWGEPAGNRQSQGTFNEKPR